MLNVKVADLNLDYVLQDDSTPTGGVSYHGETLRNFLYESGLYEDHPALDITVGELDAVLHDCGIKPVDAQGIDGKER